MNSNENIPMPTQSEKRASIDRIIDGGMPIRRANVAMLGRIFRTLGLRGLFFDSADAAALSLLCSAVVLLVFAADALNASGGYTVVCAAAPTLYLLLLCTTRWKDRNSGIEQIRYTCVITPVHICIAQSMLFSLCGLVFVTLLTFCNVKVRQSSDFLSLWSMALCSQFVCSTVTMLSIDRRCRLLPEIAAGGCAAVSVILLMLRNTAAGVFIERLLQGLSAAVMTIITVVCIAAYILTLGSALSRSNNALKGEMI